MLPPLRPRYYSISSSPLASPEACSITAGVLRGPARSGAGTFTGVVLRTTWRIAAGARHGVRRSSAQPTIAFRPPENPHTSR